VAPLAGLTNVPGPRGGDRAGIDRGEGHRPRPVRLGEVGLDDSLPAALLDALAVAGADSAGLALDELRLQHVEAPLGLVGEIYEVGVHLLRRQRRVLGQQPHQTVDVRRLPGFDEAPHELALGLALGGACGRVSRPSRRSRSSVTRARCSALLTPATVVSSRSATSFAEHVAQQEHHAPRRQRLHRRHEGQLDSLAPLGVRLGSRVRRAVVIDQPVG
jgi:hypothetical protein